MQAMLAVASLPQPKPGTANLDRYTMTFASEKDRAQQHEPQHVKGLRCWLIRCMLTKYSVFYCTPKFLPKIELGRDRRGLPAKQVSICSTFAPAKNLEKHCVFHVFGKIGPT